MSWTLAPALAKLRDEVNAVAPDRSKASDGTIGDAAHKARQSDHNPNGAGVVCAIDLTNDPKDGFPAHGFAEQLRRRCAEGKERRVAYIISNRRIASPREGWRWRDYSAQPNPHVAHIHISVKQAANFWRNTASWNVAELIEAGRAEWREEQADKPKPKPKPKSKKDENIGQAD